MSDKPNKEKGILAIGAAVTFCGLTLYAADRLLKFLFRDVDPDRVKDVDPDEAEDMEPDEIEDMEPDRGEDMVPDEDEDKEPDKIEDGTGFIKIE